MPCIPLYLPLRIRGHVCDSQAMAANDVQAWERQDNESPQAFEAFALYLEMGSERTLSRVASALDKSMTLIGGWSSKHRWLNRILMHERWEQRKINERLAGGKAEMRERHARQAMNMQRQAAVKIAKMTDAEIAAMPVRDAVALFRAASKVENDSRNIPESDLDADARTTAPTFNIGFIPSLPEGMVSVRLASGEAGYIAMERVDDFKRDYPDAVVIE